MDRGVLPGLRVDNVRAVGESTGSHPAGAPVVALTDEEMQRVLEGSESIDDFLDDEELFDSGNFVPLPADQSGPAYPLAVVILFFFCW